jgi:hypothetical protein
MARPDGIVAEYSEQSRDGRIMVKNLLPRKSDKTTWQEQLWARFIYRPESSVEMAQSYPGIYVTQTRNLPANRKLTPTLTERHPSACT